jgi:hypothetical protein
MKVLLTLAFSVLMTGTALADCTESSPGRCSEAACKTFGFTYVSSNNEDVRCVKPGSSQGVTGCGSANDSGKSIPADKSDTQKSKDAETKTGTGV